MRRSIRLTGRRQLNQSTFDFRLADVNGQRIAALTISEPSELKAYPVDAEIRVKLSENKLVEVLRFGTIGKPTSTSNLREHSFLAPSCQVRIVNRSDGEDGLLLGSTTPWTYRSGGQPEGILLFQPAAIAPRLWKLTIQDDEGYPTLYIDENLPEASLWARTDPVFTACVLPSVINEVMRRILALEIMPEDGWMSDWLSWASTLMPGSKPPFSGSLQEKDAWISQLVDAFSWKHDLANSVISNVGGK